MKNLYIDKQICSVAPNQPDFIEYEICTKADGGLVAKAYSEEDAKKIAEALDKTYQPLPLKIHVTDIDWDIHDYEGIGTENDRLTILNSLPTETDLELYAKADSADDVLGDLITDKLSELHKWCVKGCCWEIVD